MLTAALDVYNKLCPVQHISALLGSTGGNVPCSSQQWRGTHSCPWRAQAGRSSPPSSLCGPDAGSNGEALFGGGAETTPTCQSINQSVSQLNSWLMNEKLYKSSNRGSGADE